MPSPTDSVNGGKPTSPELAVICALTERFPLTFVAEQHEPHRPLKLKIDQELVAAGVLTHREARGALSLYCRRLMYLRAAVAGAARIGLDGLPAGVVTEAEAENARRTLEVRDAKIAEKFQAAFAAARTAPRHQRIAPAVESLSKHPLTTSTSTSTTTTAATAATRTRRSQGRSNRAPATKHDQTGAHAMKDPAASADRVGESAAAGPLGGGPVMSVAFEYDDGGRAAAGFKGKAGDCVTRAIAIATGKPYREVYDAIAECKREHAGRFYINAPKALGRDASPRNGVLREVYDPYLTSLGWNWTPTMKIGSGCTVHLRADELPEGRLIVSVSHHLVAVIDGVVHDTHDCSRDGARCVYGYWRKGGR
jgi:sRNA-binding protein